MIRVYGFQQYDRWHESKTPFKRRCVRAYSLVHSGKCRFPAHKRDSLNATSARRDATPFSSQFFVSHPLAY